MGGQHAPLSSVGLGLEVGPGAGADRRRPMWLSFAVVLGYPLQ